MYSLAALSPAIVRDVFRVCKPTSQGDLLECFCPPKELFLSLLLWSLRSCLHARVSWHFPQLLFLGWSSCLFACFGSRDWPVCVFDIFWGCFSSPNFWEERLAQNTLLASWHLTHPSSTRSCFLLIIFFPFQYLFALVLGPVLVDLLPAQQLASAEGSDLRVGG